MPCRLVLEGELAKLRVSLVERQEELPETGVVRARRNFPELFEGRDSDLDPEELRSSLEAELTDEARRLLASDDVTVELEWERGSLEVLALIACGKVVADIGAFLGGVREIRNLFPERIRQRILAWLGRDVAMRHARLETGAGLLRGTPAEAEKAEAARGSRPVGVGELAVYAGLALVVLVIVTAVVIGGAALLIRGQ
jgi:hypothetical protein